MSPKKIFRKTLTYVFTIGATVAVGFLSFAGMFVLTSSLIWCGAAFALAAAYEGQVNAEGISSALRRIFDKNFLKRGILRQYLEDQLEQEKDDANLFLKDYRAQKEYLEKWEAIEHPTKEQLKKISYAKKQLRAMELFFFKQYENIDNNAHYLTEIEKSARELIKQNKQKLQAEIHRKSWLIRMSWIFAIGGGISSGLAAMSAVKAGIAAFTVLSVIPGGILIGLAASAAIGYTLLLYQSISDMVQEYSGKWKSYFQKRPNESTLSCVLRCAATVLTIGIAIVATIATAGTWWYAAKQGASLLNLSDKAASVIRSISVSLMALPAFIFSTSNSIASVDNISKSSYKKLLTEGIANIKKTWATEHPLQFINPFRFVEKICSYTAKSILFLGHVVSMGLISDRFDALPASVCVGANATGEALTDLNYLPDQRKENNHDSKLLKVLFSPIIVTVTVLKLLAVVWDRPFSGSFKQSWKNIFSHAEIKQKEPEKPNVSVNWRRQQVIEVCEDTIERLKTSAPKKVTAALAIKKLISEDGNLQEKQSLIHREKKPLAENRFSFWKKAKTKSLCEMDNAIDDLLNTQKSTLASNR